MIISNPVLYKLGKSQSLIQLSEKRNKRKLAIKKVSKPKQKLKPAAEVRLDFTGYEKEQQAFVEKLIRSLK